MNNDKKISQERRKQILKDNHFSFIFLSKKIVLLEDENSALKAQIEK